MYQYNYHCLTSTFHGLLILRKKHKYMYINKFIKDLKIKRLIL